MTKDTTVGEKDMAIAQFVDLCDHPTQPLCRCDDVITVTMPGGVLVMIVNNAAMCKRPEIRAQLQGWVLFKAAEHTSIFIKVRLPQDVCIDSVAVGYETDKTKCCQDIRKSRRVLFSEWIAKKRQENKDAQFLTGFLGFLFGAGVLSLLIGFINMLRHA